MAQDMFTSQIQNQASADRIVSRNRCRDKPSIARKKSDSNVKLKRESIIGITCGKKYKVEFTTQILTFSGNKIRKISYFPEEHDHHSRLHRLRKIKPDYASKLY